MLKKLIIVGMLCLTAVACSKKKGSVATPPPADEYELKNGVCYITGTSTTVDISKCETTTSSGYKFNEDGDCCDGKGNIVNPYYCSVKCKGFHWFIEYDYYGDIENIYSVQCDGKEGSGNCSDYELVRGSDGKVVYCR